jgi:hypothetical protein
MPPLAQREKSPEVLSLRSHSNEGSVSAPFRGHPLGRQLILGMSKLIQPVTSLEVAIS